MQNLVVFMKPFEDTWETSLKGGKMILNRFCIDEDAAFELSGVHYFKNPSRNIAYGPYGMEGAIRYGRSLEFKEKRKVKGKEYPF